MREDVQGYNKIMLCIIKDVVSLHLIKIETSQETSLGLHKKFTRIMSPICGECDWCGWSYANFPCQKGRLSVVYGSCQIQLATLGILAQSWIREMLKYEANSLAPKLAWLFGSNFPRSDLCGADFFFFDLPLWLKLQSDSLIFPEWLRTSHGFTFHVMIPAICVASLQPEQI